MIFIKLEDYELDRLYIHTRDRYDPNTHPQTSSNSITFFVDATVVHHSQPLLLTTTPQNARNFGIFQFYQILCMVQTASGRNQWF